MDSKREKPPILRKETKPEAKVPAPEDQEGSEWMHRPEVPERTRKAAEKKMKERVGRGSAQREKNENSDNTRLDNSVLRRIDEDLDLTDDGSD